MSRRLHRFAGELRRPAERLDVPAQALASHAGPPGSLIGLWMDRLGLTALSLNGWRVVRACGGV